MKKPKSIFLLAIMFFVCQTVLAQTDKGIEYYNNEDYANAVKCFLQAAEQGDADAQYYLGNSYYNGEGVTKNIQEAVKWYRKAAEQGYADGQRSLADCYYTGEGVTKNFQEAVKWYRKAAEQGDAVAQYNLGVNYFNGNGVPKNPQEAMKWFRKAAEQGDADAQYWLGSIYRKGEVVAQNFTEARKWFKKAADQGKEEAQTRLDNLDNEETFAKINARNAARADRESKALNSAYIRKYGKRAAAAMDKCQPYVGMSEGALRDFAFASEDGNFNPFIFQGVIGAYKIYKPNGYLRILNAGYNLHLKYPSVVYVLNGRVSALKW